MFLAIAIVPKSHDLESAEPAREMGDGLDPDADVVRAETIAIMVLVALDQLLERVDAWEVAARLYHESTIACPRAVGGAQRTIEQVSRAVRVAGSSDALEPWWALPPANRAVDPRILQFAAAANAS